MASDNFSATSRGYRNQTNPKVAAKMSPRLALTGYNDGCCLDTI